MQTHTINVPSPAFARLTELGPTAVLRRLGTTAVLRRLGMTAVLRRLGPTAVLRRLALVLLALGLLVLTLAPSTASAAPRRDRAGASEPADDMDLDTEHNSRDAEPPPDAASAATSTVAGPPVGDVLKAAYRAAGLDLDRARSLGRRARLAGLAPSVTVRAGRNTSWQDSAPEVDRGTSFEARATWRLDRLVFDSRELQAASMQAARGRERRQLGSRVIRAYFHWRRTASAAATSPSWTARAEEAAAELDALTDGWFTGQLNRARRGTRAPHGSSAK